MKKKIKYIVERYEDKKWIFSSDHENREWAIINAEIIYDSRKLKIRIKHKGKVIFNTTHLLKLKENKK
jgi:hypothetical protein